MGGQRRWMPHAYPPSRDAALPPCARPALGTRIWEGVPSAESGVVGAGAVCRRCPVWLNSAAGRVPDFVMAPGSRMGVGSPASPGSEGRFCTSGSVAPNYSLVTTQLYRRGECYYTATIRMIVPYSIVLVFFKNSKIKTMQMTMP